MSNTITEGDRILQTETRGIRVIAAGFNEGFVIRTSGENRHFPRCQLATDDCWVIEKNADGAFFLVNMGTWVDKFKEVSREPISEHAEVAYDYYDDEPITVWRTLSNWAAMAISEAAEV